LGIRHVGLATARALAQRFPSIEALQNASLEDLRETEDVGDVIAESIYSYFRKEHNLKLIEKLARAGVTLRNTVRITIENEKIKGKTFVFTGTLAHLTREEAKNLVLERGGKVSDSVSKRTHYVVAGTAAGSKLEKAQALGITILSEAEFMNMLNHSS
jgi:DNA ligase (NAD+)